MTWDFNNGSQLFLAGGKLAWLWLIVAGFAFFLLLILYRSERKLVSRRAGLTLLTLRIAAGAILVFALFEPITSWSRQEKIRGKVIIAADISESMDTVDLLNQNLLSRREQVRNLVSEKQAPFQTLEQDHDVRTFTFAENTSLEGTLDSLTERLTAKDPETQGRSGTDWSGVLSSTLKTPDDVPLIGLILLSDGLRNVPMDDSKIVDQLNLRRVPIYSVLIGSSLPPRDVAIARLRVPDSVFKGDVVTIDLDLKADGYPAGFPLEVTLSATGMSPINQTIHLAEANARPRVSFRVPMESTGTTVFKAIVNTPADDQRKDNQDRTFAVHVADDKTNVLLIDGEARWEFRYLRNALLRDTRVALDTVVFQQPPSTNASDSTYPKSLPPPPSDKKVSDPLNRFDMIVVGDVELSQDQWTRLERFVSERGGTLVFLPGPKHWPVQGNSIDSIRALLPITHLKMAEVPKSIEQTNQALPAGIKLFPTSVLIENSANWPMLMLGTSVAASRDIWNQLPALPWVLSGHTKPGAITLISANADGSSPMMAGMSYGLGKTLWIGTDATWRWRHRIGDAIHHRFWGQVVRWASSDRLQAGNRRVRFGTKTPRIHTGETYKIQARIAEQVASIGPGFLIAARLVNAETKQDIAIIPLREVPNQPRLFEGIGPLVPAGTYSIVLDTPSLPIDPADTVIGQASLTIAPRETSERVELAASRDALDRLAVSTGGRVFTIENCNELPALLRSRAKVTTKVEETRLWDHPAGLILFLGIVGVEWIVRKRLGLP